MQITLELSAERLHDLARRLKKAFDRQQDADSGWRYVAFNHPAFGRGLAATVAERIPGNIIVESDEPGAGADALVVPCGIIDPYTRDVLLADGDAVDGRTNPEPPRDDDDPGAEPDDRLPAVALWTEAGRVQALLGTIHSTREHRFELEGVGANLASALTDRLHELAAELNGQGSGLAVGQAPRSSATSGHGIGGERSVLFDSRS